VFVLAQGSASAAEVSSPHTTHTMATSHRVAFLLALLVSAALTCVYALI
jgi:hypothetical protein